MLQGTIDVDIGAEEDEGVDDQAVKVVDIVDTFRLQVRFFLYNLIFNHKYN